MTIDSCYDPKTRLHYPLAFLNDLNVDVEQDLDLVVATHWHDDHIRGLSELVERASSAAFACSTAFLEDEFLAVIGQRLAGRPRSGVAELQLVLGTLSLRAATPKLASGSTLLWQGEGASTRVWSLSPSAASIVAAIASVSGLAFAPGEAVPWHVRSLTRNDASVVIALETDAHCALFGADLEVTTSAQQGWEAILFEPAVAGFKAGLMKVPHHGSAGAHHSPAWIELCTDRPQAILTPWRRAGRHLPTTEGQALVCNHSGAATITARPREGPSQVSLVESAMADVASIFEWRAANWAPVVAIAGAGTEWEVAQMDPPFDLCELELVAGGLPGPGTRRS